MSHLAMRAASIASTREPVVPVVPALDMAPSGRLPYTVTAQAADDPADVAQGLILAGLDEAATATTPKRRADGELTALVGHTMRAVRAMAAQYQADGRNVAWALDDALMSGGALAEVLDDAIRNVLNELADRDGRS